MDLFNSRSKKAMVKFLTWDYLKILPIEYIIYFGVQQLFFLLKLINSKIILKTVKLDYASPLAW